MKKIILLTMAALLAFVAIAYAQTVPADKLQIKLNEAWNVKQTQKGVLYNHEPHIKALNNKCDSCHSSPQGATKIQLQGEIKGANANNAAHKFCWTCHDNTPK
ncbi:MAG: hypothetical protein K2N11_09795, partial [Mucispirillum sp.]|nr:hypothetical protein [Mucispirillum sp.]